MNNRLMEMAQDLNRDIVKEVKAINARLTSGTLTEAQIKGQMEAKRELNKQRISALGLFLIPGGKYNE